jgi:hypothetical protein
MQASKIVGILYISVVHRLVGKEGTSSIFIWYLIDGRRRLYWKEEALSPCIFG